MNKKALIKDLNDVYNLVSDHDITEAMERLEFVISEVKQLHIPVVGSSNKVDYKEGFELAKSYIDKSPCDPDIYKEQLADWDKYQIWLKNNKLT